jgi:hypothetical protein
VLLEFSPRPEAQPLYMGVGNTALTPIAFAAPIAAGMLADRAGFAALFVTATVASGLALATIALRVREPRHLRALVETGA